jgi:hypothetical protein
MARPIILPLYIFRVLYRQVADRGDHGLRKKLKGAFG